MSEIERGILLRYHEVALKGGNRGWFEERLAYNVRRMIQRHFGNEVPLRISRQHGRMVLYTPWDDQLRNTIQRVFGLTGFSPIRLVPTDKEKILAAALEEFAATVARDGLPRSFRVLTRRSDKALPEISTAIDHYIGGEINDRYPQVAVAMKNPELTVGIEIRFEKSFIWTERIAGEGGLPVGTNSRLLALMSGGLDSPVAAIQALRRGSSVSFIHFYGTPFVGEEALHKVEDLVRIVNRYQPEPEPLHIVPFGKLQEKIALATQPKLRTVLYRRMMIRIAAKLAERLEALALVTGESVGQVASQTVENIATIDAVAPLPILRPLITYDKDEIIEAAKKWGTYETSIRPAEDCCTLFADRHPSLRSTPSLAEAEEAKFPVDELVNEALTSVETKRAW